MAAKIWGTNDQVLAACNKKHTDFPLLRGHVGNKNQNLVCMAHLLAMCARLTCHWYHLTANELGNAYCHQVCDALRPGMQYVYTQMLDQVKSSDRGP